VPTLDANAAPMPTHVTPAGDYIRADLAPGTTIDLDVADCWTAVSTPHAPLGSNMRNQIPTTGNPSTAGAVHIPLRHPSIVCPDTGNQWQADTYDGWTLTLQQTASGPTAKLRIPQGGMQLSGADGVWVCNKEVAPNGPVVLPGTWTNGKPSTFKVTNAAVPALNGGGGDVCGTGIVTLHFSFTWQISDVSNSSASVAVN
jgi:hypothetical protein